MSITYKELLGSHTIAEVPIQHQHNLEDLLKKINLVRNAWAKSMIVTSGYRSLQEHIQIYSRKGIDANHIPMGSSHLTGCAVDISDPDGSLMKFCKENFIPVKYNLYCEDGTIGWIHFQTVSPKSGKQWFLP